MKRCLAIVAATALCVGCAATGRVEPPAVAAAATHEPPPYRYARGDELNLRFFYTPELNTVATVRSDGRITLPLLGELRAEGKSTAELSSEIVALLARLVKRPDVSIDVQGTRSQRVFVGGEVARPGVQPLLGPLSVAQAVMVAEGLKDTSNAGRVVVVRQGAQGERSVIEVDLAAVLDGRDPAQDLLLQPYDVVVVPRSGIAQVNLWVDQYLRRNLPVSLGVSYAINPIGVVR